MSNNKMIALIEDEIDSLSEMLKTQSYHLYALRDLRKKLIDELREPIDPPKPLVVQSAEVKAKPKKPKYNKEYKKLALDVASLVKSKGVTKMDALREIIKRDNLGFSVQSGMARIAPSNIGRAFNKNIFKGTKYAS